jgi:hypothetical protein
VQQWHTNIVLIIPTSSYHPSHNTQADHNASGRAPERKAVSLALVQLYVCAAYSDGIFQIARK